jgi:hypothetical protein
MFSIALAPERGQALFNPSAEILSNLGAMMSKQRLQRLSEAYNMIPNLARITTPFSAAKNPHSKSASRSISIRAYPGDLQPLL